MRDGIFRTCPVPNRWRNVGDVAANEAERDTFLITEIEWVVKRDLIELSSDPFFSQLVKRLETNDLSLIGEEATNLVLSTLPTPEHRLVDWLIDDLQHSCANGELFKLSTVTSSLENVLAKHVDAMTFELKCHASNKNLGRELSPIISALTSATSQANYGSIVDQVVIKKDRKTKRPKKKPLDPNESIL